MVNMRPAILLTNDDGVNSIGLWAAYEALKPVADVTVVAPATPIPTTPASATPAVAAITVRFMVVPSPGSVAPLGSSDSSLPRPRW